MHFFRQADMPKVSSAINRPKEECKFNENDDGIVIIHLFIHTTMPFISFDICFSLSALKKIR